MIYPTASDILRCVEQTLLTVSDEAVPRLAVNSALATCRHLIRHVELRIRLEKSILLDDIEKAGALLEKIAAYLDGGAADPDGLARVIRAVLAEAPQLQSAAPDATETIRLRAKALRELVYSSLAHLIAAAATEQATESYREMRRLLREYMTYQIEQEALMIYPAFAGKGPRR